MITTKLIKTPKLKILHVSYNSIINGVTHSDTAYFTLIDGALLSAKDKKAIKEMYNKHHKLPAQGWSLRGVTANAADTRRLIDVM